MTTSPSRNKLTLGTVTIAATITVAETENGHTVLNCSILRISPLLSRLAAKELEGVVVKEGVHIFFLLLSVVCKTTGFSQNVTDSLGILDWADRGGVGNRESSKGEKSELHGDLVQREQGQGIKWNEYVSCESSIFFSENLANSVHTYICTLIR